MAVFFFYGDEDYLIDLELKKAKSELDENFSAMNFVECSYNEKDKKMGIDFAQLISLLISQPMMFGKRIVVINSNNLLSATLEDSQIDEISSCLSSNTDGVDIYFVAKFSKDDKKKKPDSRKKLFKLLSKYNSKEFQTIPVYKKDALVDWINTFAKQRGLNVPNDVALTMIDSIGNNLRQLDTELAKLELIAYPEKTVTKEMIKQVCISNEDLFNLTDYIILNKRGDALLEMRKLLVNKHPLELLAPLQTMLKQWIVIKLYSKSMSYQELSRKVGLHEFVVKKTLEKLKNTPLKSLVQLRCALCDTEYRIKTGQALNPQEELENAII